MAAQKRKATRIVADFNTLEDLVAHAARDLGATHAIIAGPETKIFFPRGGTHSYEEARVWRKGGYWHAEGPGARTGVSRLPSDAKPIGASGGRRAAESTEAVKRSPKAAGIAYADDQINGDYFRDWAHDQLIESNRNPEGMLPLETKAQAAQIARNMLQQLEWDTKRELSESKEFFEGFSARLADRVVIGWLADELLSMNAEIVGAAVAETGVREQRRVANGWNQIDRGIRVWVSDGEPMRVVVAKRKQSDAELAVQKWWGDQPLSFNWTGRQYADISRDYVRGHVRDYAAVDTRDRVIAGPFKQYSDAKDAAGAGGHVKYVPGKRAVHAGRRTVRAGISPDKKQAAFRRLDHFFGSPANQKKGFASDDAAASSAATLLSAQMKLKYGTAIEIVKEWYRR